MRSVTLILDKRRELPAKYKKLLESPNNTVIIAKNLISAMKAIQDKEPDLIIISESAGADLAEGCRKIRALTYNMRPVIAAVSKSGELEDKLKALESGADDFISEPVNSEEFVMRMKAHLRREYESGLDPKKFLPNKNYSLRALKRLVSQEQPWACLLISLENFANYRETYTELASDKLAHTFAAIVQSALGENDYFGGISDNEYLIITDRFKAEKIANYIVFALDSVVPKFYSAQDNKRGFMLMQGDEFAGRRSNFVHATIGVVTDEFVRYEDPTQLMNALTHTRNMAEIQTRSHYLAERPQISAEDAVLQYVYNKKVLIIEEDEAMSLLLKTILELQGFSPSPGASATLSYQGRGDEPEPAVAIIDAGENLEGLEILKTLREKFSNTKIIMTSVLHDKELILGAGADLYLPKPYELSVLVKWVGQLIREVN
ncbi:MAG: response regulator [Heliobacteriaceae bacterium]|jgi:DNA-binding response OmpR family regulator|nr:response regulator [Heliobacteriaceae bacterium]